MVIDVGSVAINRSSNRSSFGILVENPANADGKITQVEIWLRYVDTLKVTVGIWEPLGGDTFKCRSAADLGMPPAGSKQTFIVDMAVKAGDYIAIEMTKDGDIEADTSGGQGVRWMAVGNRNVVGNEVTVAINLAADTWSVYGTGEEVAIGGGAMAASLLQGAFI